jgi:hypothetical protein
MTTLNFKSLTSAFCALALTALLSWSFVGSFNQVYGARSTNSGFLAAITALVR